MVADFIPVVSNVKAVYEVVEGKDPFTGRKIEAWERGASAISIFRGPIVKGIKHGGKAVVGIVKNGSNSTKKTTAASKPKDTPKQKKQEEKKKSDTLQLPNVNKPAEVKQQGTSADDKLYNRSSFRKGTRSKAEKEAPKEDSPSIKEVYLTENTGYVFYVGRNHFRLFVFKYEINGRYINYALN